MIGIIYATEKEAEPLYSFNLNKSIKIKISGIGLESARIAAEELIDQGAKIIINPGICAGLHNRVKRGHVYRISSVVTEEINNLYVIVRGRKEVLFRKRKRLIEIQGLIARKDISPDDKITSDSFLESSIKIIR